MAPLIPVFRSTLLAALMCSVASGALAGSKDQTDNPWTFNFFFENDLFGDTDQHYTNGMRFSWMSPDLLRYRDSGRVPEWGRPVLEKLLFFDDPNKELFPGESRNVVLSIGQSMFTPEDIAAFDLVEEDRPYAGWLYGAIAFRKREPDVLDTLEIQLGVVGPLSLAEQAQSLVHEIRDLDKPNGWEHQLENEPTLGLVYQRKLRLLEFDPGGREGLEADFIPHIGAALGNAFIYGSVGAELRVGWNIPQDFGEPIIRPGGVTGPSLVWGRQRFSIYGFVFADLRAVGRDITLDGNTFADSHSVDKRPLVADVAVGGSMIMGRLKLTFTKVIRSREFEGQDDDHHFGSVSMSYSY